MADRIRILIVDDSAFVRRAVHRMLSDQPDFDVVGSASNGAEAVELVRRHRPDVVVLDVNMPELDGIEALRRIMASTPTSVLMMSTLTRDGARTTLQALELGAVDFVDKTSMGTVMDIYRLGPTLCEKVRAVAGASVVASPPGAEEAAAAPPQRVQPAQRWKSRYEVVVIGTSTGGPRALVELLSSLPEDFPAGIVIAQHMPAGFTQTLAERLNRRSALEVREARDGDVIGPGLALLAPGGTQVVLSRTNGTLTIRVEEGNSELLHRPSVDLLLRSATTVSGDRAIGVILTGMGSDGAEGLRMLRDAGARTVAESEESSVIYGMPRAAAAAAEKILPLRDIGPWLAAICADAPARPAGGP